MCLYARPNGHPALRRGMRFRAACKRASHRIGWSNNYLNNLHFIVSLEANMITTCFK